MNNFSDVQKSSLFLLSLLRFANSEADEKVALLNAASEQDWQNLLYITKRYQMLPVLFWRIRPLLEIADIPQAVVQELRNSFLTSTSKNMLLNYHLGQMVKAFGEAGIPAILLKGAHLANFVYPDIAMRSMSDLDFLIQRQMILQCAEMFYAQGYQASVEMRPDDALAVSHQLPYFVKPGFPMVELHWTIIDPKERLAVDLDGLWDRARVVDVLGFPALVLAPEDLLLHLILHVSHHHNFGLGLRPFYDLAASIDYYRDEIDWAQLFNRAAQWGVFRGVYLALLLTDQFFNPPIPSAVLQEMRPDSLTPEMVELLRDYVLRFEPQVNENLADLVGGEKLPQKALHFLRRFFPPRTILSTIYNVPPNSVRIYLYYLVRPFDLLRANAAALWKLLRGDRQALAAARRQSDVAALRKWMVS